MFCLLQCTPILPKHPLLPPFSSPPFLPTGPMVTSPMVPLPLPHTPSSQPHLLLSQPPPPLPTLLSSTSGAGSGVGGGSSNSSGGGGPIRRRVSDKCNLPISTGRCVWGFGMMRCYYFCWGEGGGGGYVRACMCVNE